MLRMKFLAAAVPTLVVLFPRAGAAGKALSQGDALNRVIELMDALTERINSEAKKADKAYQEYYEWCDETVHNKQYEIEQHTIKQEKLKAIIEKAVSDQEASEGKISDLAGKIKQTTQDKEKADQIRAKELADFKDGERELMEADDQISRAIDILEKEMAKNPAVFAQVDASSFSGVLNGLGAVVDAAGMDGNSKQRLLALVQAHQEEADDDEAPGAPDPKAYKTHSGPIVDVLEDMKSKAEAQLKALRATESEQKQNHKLLTEGLQATIDADTKTMQDEKEFLAETKEAGSVAKKELVLTEKALRETNRALESVRNDCMRTAADHEASIEGRKDELNVIAQAKTALQESQSLLQQQQGSQEEDDDEQPESFVQTQSKHRSRLRSRSKHAREKVALLVKQLSEDYNSAALAQLASKITALMQFGAASGEDPFAKVKGLITGMIAKLQREAKAAADEKSYCDDQIAKTQQKQEDLETDHAKLTATIDTKVAQSADLKKQVKEVQEEIAKLTKEKAELQRVRSDENAAYKTGKAELEKGLYGVKKALKILRKYYGSREDDALLQTDDAQPAKPVMHAKAEGAGGTIISILEQVEADLAQNLAELEQEEADGQNSFDKRMQEIEVELESKGQDVKYKQQESKGLDQAVSELSESRDSTQEELDAVLDYFAKVKERCVAKPETYEERKKRREAELKGLKEALSILEDEAAMLQRHSRGRAGAAALATDK